MVPVLWAGSLNLAEFHPQPLISLALLLKLTQPRDRPGHLVGILSALGLSPARQGDPAFPARLHQESTALP